MKEEELRQNPSDGIILVMKLPWFTLLNCPLFLVTTESNPSIELRLSLHRVLHHVCVCLQVVIALSGGELVYFEMDMVSELGRDVVTGRALAPVLYALFFCLSELLTSLF